MQPLQGVHRVLSGYTGGHVADPSYREVCGGRTGHAEVVLVVFDPSEVSFEELLRIFWESHDPTQGMRQGADTGTQYRSTIYWFDEAQKEAALASREAYGRPSTSDCASASSTPGSWAIVAASLSA